jgi:YHS domain-containing protein
MKRFAVLMVAGSLVLSALCLPAIAKTPMAKTKTAAVLKCPACGMPMSTHKTAMMPYPIKVNGKTYYCCAQCASMMKAKLSKKAK